MAGNWGGGEEAEVERKQNIKHSTCVRNAGRCLVLQKYTIIMRSTRDKLFLRYIMYVFTLIMLFMVLLIYYAYTRYTIRVPRVARFFFTCCATTMELFKVYSFLAKMFSEGRGSYRPSVTPRGS